MPDDRAPDEHFRRDGRSGLLSFKVRGPRGAGVVVTVEHRDPEDAVWSGAGSFLAIAPSASMVRVSCLKEELRLRVAGDPGVHVLTPEWLPC